MGVNPKGIKNKDSCSTVAEDACMTAMNKKLIHDYIEEVATTPEKAIKRTFTFTTPTLFPVDKPANCVDKEASFYVQYSCTQTDEQLAQKYKETSIISCMGVFLVCVYLITIYYFKRISKLKQLDWDIQTITPGDYTLQMEITDKAYDWFLTNIYPRDKNRGLSIGESLKAYMKSELEKILTDKLKEIKATGSETSSIKISEVKIADISFAFNNAELIKLLRERGGHIMYQRYDKMRETENKISILKNEKFNELVKPVDAFITFEEEDGNIIG